MPISSCRMRFVSISVVVIIALCILESCRQRENVASTPALDSDTVVAEDHSDGNLPEQHDVIAYAGVAGDSVKVALSVFPPLTEICSLAARLIYKEDSLCALPDTSSFKLQEDRVYNAILDYKKKMEAGELPSSGGTPSLLQLTRTMREEDTSLELLPEAGESSFLSKGNFFFLGGAPFIFKQTSNLETSQKEDFKDEKGNPELRFNFQDLENVEFAFRSIYHFKKPRVKVSFGPPISDYEKGLVSVKGIGSIIHNFIDRIPALLLTEKGIVSAHIIQYQEPIVIQYSCYSDFSKLVFATNTLINENDILGVLIPYENSTPAICQIRRNGQWVWTADLNGDGVAELACVNATFLDLDDGLAFHLAWFANVDGTWEIIEYGSQPICT